MGPTATPTQPKPAQVIARKRNGAPRRIDISAQYLHDALALLASVPGPRAQALKGELSAVLRPICYWSSPRRSHYSASTPAWGMCAAPVDAPGERCREHRWPLPEGVADPFPRRCVAVLDEELDDYRWLKNSAGLRCPFDRRPGSELCPHHDPGEDELCGYRDGDTPPCRTPESGFPCRHHRESKLSRYAAQLDELTLSTTCRHCKAVPQAPCTSSAAKKVNFHKKRLQDARSTSLGEELIAEIEWLS